MHRSSAMIIINKKDPYPVGPSGIMIEPTLGSGWSKMQIWLDLNDKDFSKLKAGDLLEFMDYHPDYFLPTHKFRIFSVWGKLGFVIAEDGDEKYPPIPPDAERMVF